ncbi:MAG: hypothetical protein ACPGYX_00850, partial [Oceanobacter sp.]
MHRKVPPIIDLEASGFGSGSYPIEIGYALEDLVPHTYLVRPAPGWDHWSDDAEKIHGISRDLLLQEGISPREIAIRLNDSLHSKTLYSDAWSFDSSWLGRL